MAFGENSCEGRTRIIGTYGILSNETDSQAKIIHLTYNSNHCKGEINNNNISIRFIGPYFTLQKEKHESEGETSGSDRKVKQNTNLEVSLSIEVTMIGE